MGGRFPKFPVAGSSDECLPRSSRRTQGSSHHPHPTSLKLQGGHGAPHPHAAAALQADYQILDETISATSLLHQTISRLNKEIRQKTTEVTELSRIINARHKALETQTVELLVQEQLSKIKKQLSTDMERWSEIVKECKSVYAHITVNTKSLEPKKAAQTSDSRRSSSSSSALAPASRIQAANSNNVEGCRNTEQEMRVIGMRQKERELEDHRVESKLQKISQEEETVTYYKGEYVNLLAKQSSKKHNSHSQNYQNELRQQLQVLEESHACELKDASTCHQHQLAALWEHHEADMAALTDRAKYFEKRYLETQSRMQKAEKLLADHAFVDSASYRDDSATPTLLQAAADGVKGAVSMCASSIFKFIHAHSLPINLQYLLTVLGQHQLDVNGHNRKVVVKMALQAFLCEFLFQGFENAAYSSSTQTFQSRAIAFEKPEIHRKQQFQDFKRLRYLEPVQMLEQDHEFNSFLKAKAAFVGNEIFNLLQIHNGHEFTEQAETHKQLISSELLGSSPHSPFFKSFLRLAKAAWQLHKLAFACEPASAEIFRVAPNSVFLGDYMEEHEDTRSKTSSLLPHEDNEDGGKLVTLMNVPGFTVRNSVIRSVVCCMHSAGPSHESTS